MNIKHYFYKISLFTFLAVGLSACARQSLPVGAICHVGEVAGFWTGLWDGFIAFFDLVGHLLNPSIRIYSVPNSGGWYDFGFYLGFANYCSLVIAVRNQIIRYRAGSRLFLY